MLNTRQRAFVDAYCITGNTAEAARRAGYSVKTARVIGQRLLTNVDIQRAIQSREEEKHAEAVAGRQERMEFLTGVMRDSERGDVYRLKAADLLGKLSGDYINRTELSGPAGRPLEMKAAREPDRDYSRLTFEEMSLLDAIVAKLEGDPKPMERLKACYPYLAPLPVLSPDEAANA